MRQHPRPTYGKARGQWPPQLDKGDLSAQFHGQMESARRLSLTVEFSAPLRCIRQRCSLTRRVFFMQGMKNGTECTLSRENETLPGAKPDSERNRYDPCTTERHRRPRRPPKRAGREKGGAKNTDLPFRRSAWYIYMVVQDSRTRRARPLQLCPTQCNSPGSRRGGQPSLLVCSLPSHGLTHNGGLSSRRLTPLRCILALTVPVVRGLATPFPSMPTPGPWWAVRPPATLDQQTVYLLVSDIILQELAVVNPPPYPSATSRIIITVKPAAKASAPGPESPRVGSSSAATT